MWLWQEQEEKEAVARGEGFDPGAVVAAEMAAEAAATTEAAEAEVLARCSMLVDAVCLPCNQLRLGAFSQLVPPFPV